MTSDNASPPPVDVNAVMETIRERVATKRAEGAYASDALFEPAPAGGDVWAPGRLEAAEAAGIVVPELVVGASTRPVIGSLVQKLKGFVARANAGSVAHSAMQQNRFNANIVGYAAELGAEVHRLRRDVTRLETLLAEQSTRPERNGSPSDA